MIFDNVKKIREQILTVCKRSGKDPAEICIVAVTKTIAPDIIKQAYEAGLRNFGENKVQELLTKTDKVPDDIGWHMVGHLQRNKVKYIASFIDLIHSVDNLDLAREINKYGEMYKREIPILIQVNTSNEESKFGIEPEKAIELIKQVSLLKNIKLNGLMTMGAFLEDPEMVRPCFRLLRNIKEEILKLNIENILMKHLSMGMTHDFEVAIEEGATMIRIGTAIFGERYK